LIDITIIAVCYRVMVNKDNHNPNRNPNASRNPDPTHLPH